MARKNPFANLMDDKPVNDGLVALDYTIKGASRSIISSIDELAERADKLLEGETVVELDPDIIDDSFVRDRIEDDPKEFEDLVSAIRERGQDSPVLVRPHPRETGRYMVVFGHRRLEAARQRVELMESTVIPHVEHAFEVARVAYASNRGEFADLLDTERVYRTSLTSALTDLGYADGLTISHAMIGIPAAQCEVMLFDRYGTDFRIDDVRRAFVSYKDDMLRDGLPLKNGTLELLDALRAADCPMAIVTSSSRRAAEEALLRARLKRAKAEGDLPSDADPAAFARYIAAVMQGMAVQAAGGASRAELRRIADTALLAFPK